MTLKSFIYRKRKSCGDYKIMGLGACFGTILVLCTRRVKSVTIVKLINAREKGCAVSDRLLFKFTS